MGAIRHMISAFLAGEISPMLGGRVDTTHYAYGLDTCENFVPMIEGPIVKRPGFEYIRDADPTASWLSAFRYSVRQQYAIEWGNLKARFFTQGGRIESPPGTAYEVATPYAAADCPLLSFQQSHDRLYIDHPAYPPGALSRTGAVTFSYAASVLSNGPFRDQNTDKTLTITPSGATGSITLTASSALFSAGHVGALWRIEVEDFASLTAWEPGRKDVTVGTQVRSDGKIYQALSTGVTGGVQPIHEAGSYYDGQNLKDVSGNGPYGVRWQYVSGKYGIVRITGFTSSTVVTATVVKDLPPVAAGAATWRWSEGAFSDARGWPGLVLHFKGRQIHFKDFDVCASVVGDYLNHDTATSNGTPEADLAFRRTLATDNPPMWVVADRAILAGTADRELAIGPTNAAAALSGANIEATPQSYYGSDQVWPVQVGTATLFVELGGRRLRSTDFDFARDRYNPVDLTAAARHVTAGGIVQLAYQRWPTPLIHAVRGDGQIVTHPMTREDIKGFCRLVPGGNATIISAVCFVGADGKSDDLWVLVSRPTPGGTRREIWKQASWRELGDPIEQAFYVDAGVKVAASAGQTHFTGLTHLAGQAVAVLAGGNVVQGLSVAGDGSLDLPASAIPVSGAYTMVVGLPFTATAVTLRPEPPGQSASIQGLRQRVVRLVLRLLDTLGVKAGGVHNEDGVVDPLEEVLLRPSDTALDEVPPLFSGDTVATAIATTYNRNGQVQFVSDVPLPAMISAAMLKLDVDTKDA